MFRRLTQVLKIAAIGVLGLAVFVIPLSAIADVKDVVTDVTKLVDPKAEQVIRVKTANIILADYALIRRDFKNTLSMSNDQIDQWLLSNSAFVSDAQANQTVVNTPIEPLKNEAGENVTKTAYRPQGYGRALVFQTDDDSLIDVKGSGARSNPVRESHRTGLASLGEMIREFLFQKKVQQILEFTGSGYQTVGCYAVIDWGFDTFEISGQQMRAGAVLRQAHVRPRLVQSGNHFLNDVETKTIETIFRNFGLATTGDGSTKTLERANLQAASSGELIDFGTYVVKENFSARVIHYGSESTLFVPGTPSFNQPNPAVQLPFNVWGSSESGKINPRFDNPWIWSHRLAESIKTGEANRHNVEQHFQTFMNAGPLPNYLRGSFAHLQTKAAKATAFEEILILKAASSKYSWRKVLEQYLQAEPKPKLKTLSKILTVEALNYDAENIYNKVKSMGLFETVPGLQLLLYERGNLTSKKMGEGPPIRMCKKMFE